MIINTRYLEYLKCLKHFKCLKYLRYLKCLKYLKLLSGIETAGCGSPCHGDGTLRDLNSSTHTGDKLDGAPDVPGGSGTPLSPSWRYAFSTACRCTFLQSPSNWLAWKIWKEVQVEGHSRGWRSPMQHYQEGGGSKGASDSLRGAWGKRCLLQCHLLLLWGHWHTGGGDMMGSLWGLPQTIGSLSALHTRGRSPTGIRNQLGSFIDPSSHEVL